MNVRALLPCLIGLVGVSLASTSEARSIRVDAPPTLGTCTAVSVDSVASSFDPQVGFSATDECNSTSGNDQAGGDPFETDVNKYSNLNLYQWESSGSILAQVADYTLTGGALDGLTEIEFNYADAPLSCGSGPARLDWGGTTYSGTCDGTSNYSLLFDGTTLVGALNNSNVDTVCAAGSTDCLLGTGWTVGTTTPTVPEPNTLALLALAGLPLTLVALHRRGKTRVI